MWKYLLTVTAAVLSIKGTSALSFSSLPSTTSVTSGGDLTLSVNVSDVTAETILSWVLGDVYIANITLNVTEGNPSLKEMETQNDKSYAFETDIREKNVTVIFRLVNISASYNGKTVKLVIGPSDDVATTLDVQDKEETQPVTATPPETNAPTENMTSPTGTTSSDTSQSIAASEAPSVTSGPTTPTAPASKQDCGSPPVSYDSNCTTVGCVATYNYEMINRKGHGTKFLITNTTTCSVNGNETAWADPISVSEEVCNISHLYGENCMLTCGPGCEGGCDETGKCIGEADGVDGCKPGYKGRKYCNESICDPQDCSGGTCVAPGICAMCPHQFAPHYVEASGQIICRNLRLDGFLRGSLPSLAVLALIVIALSFGSKWYIKRKMKEH